MSRPALVLKSTRGQAGAEVMITVVFLVAGLIALGMYIHRGYSGYLYAQTQSQGQQFDPNSVYTDTRTLAGLNINQQSETKAMAGPNNIAIPEGYCNDADPIGQGCAPNFPSSPTASNIIMETESKSQTNWNMGRNATYTAN